MVPINSQSVLNHAIEVNRADRWAVCHRLQELGISCCCSTNFSLQVNIASSTAAIQLWSVVKQVTASRNELVRWLNNCWDKDSSI